MPQNRRHRNDDNIDNKKVTSPYISNKQQQQQQQKISKIDVLIKDVFGPRRDWRFD